jgi:very-short-patch-repair endonuclease
MPRKKSDCRLTERVTFARQQRFQANEFSRAVWELVRDRRMLGEKFRREYPIGPYTLDFVCLDLKLNLEVDGQDHLTDQGKRHDVKRDAYLHRMGYKVLRLSGYQVIQDAAWVQEEIARLIRTLRAPIPSPPIPLLPTNPDMP